MPKVPLCPWRRCVAAIASVVALLFLSALAAPGAAADPVIALQDVDLGEVGRGIVRQSTISICNTGDGRLTFGNPGGSVVTGLGSGFSVSSKDLEKLAAASLGPGECFRLNVSFVSATPGVRTTTIRVWASTRTSRDTAVLRATVTEPNPQIVGVAFGARQLSTAGSACTKNPVADYEADVVVVNLGSGSLVVDRIELAGDGIGGAIRLDSAAGAPHIARGDVLGAATATDTQRLVQRVRFAPDAERSYSATIVIAFNDGSSVRSTITGTGFERHVGVIDSLAFGVVDATSLPVRRTLVISAVGSAPTTITGASVSGDPAIALVGGEAFPLTMQPGESRELQVELRRAADGPHRATLSLSGDFTRCDDSTVTITAVLTGIGSVDAVDATTRLELAPSVTSERTSLRYTLDRRADVRLELVSALGTRTTLAELPSLAAGTHRQSIDIAALAAGHYTVVLTAAGRRATARLLIVR